MFDEDIYLLTDGSKVTQVPSHYTGEVSFKTHNEQTAVFSYFKGNWHSTTRAAMLYTDIRRNRWYLLSNRIIKESNLLIIVG